MPESTTVLHACERCGNVYSTQKTRHCPVCNRERDADA